MIDIFEHLKENFNIEFDSAQKQVAKLDKGIGLMLAVPGAGKTTVLVSRVFNMIAGGVNPRNILNLTYSRASARDMKTRYNKLFGEFGQCPPKFSTLHSFCYGVLGEYERKQGAAIYQLIDEEKYFRNTILRGVYQSTVGEYPDDDKIEEVSRTIAYLKNIMVGYKDARAMKFDLKDIPAVYEAYEVYKRRNKIMDYEDMMSYALAVLRREGKILEDYQEQYRHILVDEAQDISPIGYEIIETISSDCESLLYVGDEDQSIYGFRGASPSYLVDLPKKYKDVALIKAQQSFRCPSTVSDVANKIIKQNKKRYDKEIIPFLESGKEPVEILAVGDIQNQYKVLLDLIESTPKDKTIGILYRNNTSAIGIIDPLVDKGIEFYIKEFNSRFAAYAIVKDVIAVLKLSQCPWDTESFKRICYKIGAYISKPMLEEVINKTKKGDNVFDVLTSMGEQINSSSRLMFLKYRLTSLPKLTPAKMVDVAIDDFGLLDYIKENSSLGYNLESAIQKINALKTIAARCESLDMLLERIEEIDQIIAAHSKNSGNPRITLTTMHSAKGIEFDYVFIIDLLEGILPASTAIESARKDGDSTLMEEEVRIFYVALTRARKKLCLLYPTGINQIPLVRSRFIDKIAYVSPPNGEDVYILGERHKKISIKPKQDLNELCGKKILHTFFGSGVVKNVDAINDTVYIDFGSLGIKKFTANIFESGIAHLVCLNSEKE